MRWLLRRSAPQFLAVLVVSATAANLVQAQSLEASVAGGVTPSPDIPVNASPAQPGADFELGAGDVIRITVWREAELSQTTVVPPDGKISMPLAGQITISGKTAQQAQSEIRDLLLKYFTDPKVTVSVMEIHSRQVFITGQVQRPGAYPLLGSCNVLQLIASAGGLTPYAHKKRIVVLDPNNHPLAEFDYASAVKGDPRQGRVLEPGDTVVVP
jgi:polysaccharide biosynthesis/export protein